MLFCVRYTFVHQILLPPFYLSSTSILNKRRVISLPYKQRALSGSIGEKLKEKMGHKLMIGSHYSYEYGKLPWPLGGLIVPLGGVMGYG